MITHEKTEEELKKNPELTRSQARYNICKSCECNPKSKNYHPSNKYSCQKCGIFTS